MKKLLLLTALLGTGFLYQSANAQVVVSADVHIGHRFPPARPVEVYYPERRREVIVYEPVRHHHRHGRRDICFDNRDDHRYYKYNNGRHGRNDRRFDDDRDRRSNDYDRYDDHGHR